MLQVNRAIEQFSKRLPSITAVKDGHAEHCVQVFHITAFLFTATIEPDRIHNCYIAHSM